MRISRKVIPISASGGIVVTPGIRQCYDTEFNEYSPDFTKGDPFKVALQYDTIDPNRKDASGNYVIEAVTSYQNYILEEYINGSWVTVSNGNGITINSTAGFFTLAKNNTLSQDGASSIRKFKISADIKHPSNQSQVGIKVIHETELILDVRSNASLVIKKWYPHGQKASVLNKIPFTENSETERGYLINCALHKGNEIRPYTYYYWYRKVKSDWELLTTQGQLGCYNIHGYELSIPFGSLRTKNDFKVIAVPCRDLKKDAINLLPTKSSFVGNEISSSTKAFINELYIFDKDDDIVFSAKNKNATAVKLYIQCFNDSNTPISKTQSGSVAQNVVGTVTVKIPANTRYIKVGIDSISGNLGAYNIGEAMLGYGTTTLTYKPTLPEGSTKPTLSGVDTSDKFEEISSIVKEFPNKRVEVDIDSNGDIPVGVNYYRCRSRLNTSSYTMDKPEYDYSFEWKMDYEDGTKNILVGTGSRICNEFPNKPGDIRVEVSDGLFKVNYTACTDGVSQYLKNASAVSGLLTLASGEHKIIQLQYIHPSTTTNANDIISIDDNGCGLSFKSNGKLFAYNSTNKKEIQINDPRIISDEIVDLRVKIARDASGYKFYYSLFFDDFKELTSTSTGSIESAKLNSFRIGEAGNQVCFLKFINSNSSNSVYHYYDFDPSMSNEDFDFNISLKDKNADGTIKTTNAINLQAVNITNLYDINPETGFFKPL